MKQTKFNSDKFTADMDKVLAKHKIKSGAFVSEHNGGILAYVKLKNSTVKKEFRLADALIELFDEIELNEIDIKAITYLVRDAKLVSEMKEVETLTKQAIEELAFLKLSDKDKMICEDIRKKKLKAVDNQKWEEACKLRDEELEILGYPHDKK